MVTFGVEREPPRVAEAVGPDLALDTRDLRERVIVGDDVGVAAAVVAALGLGVDINAEDRAEEVVLDVLAVAAVVDLVPVLRAALDEAHILVVTVAAVAEGDVEVAVLRPEGERPGVVVHVRVVHLHQDLLRAQIGHIRVGGGSAELREDVGVVEPVGRALTEGRAVENEEPPIRGVVRVEGEAEEAALVVPVVELDEAIFDVEKRLVEALALGGHDPDLACLVHDEEAAGVVGRLGEGEGVGEPVGDERECGLGLGSRRHGEGDEKKGEEEQRGEAHG